MMWPGVDQGVWAFTDLRTRAVFLPCMNNSPYAKVPALYLDHAAVGMVPDNALDPAVRQVVAQGVKFSWRPWGRDGAVADQGVTFISLGVALNLWSEQFVHAVRGHPVLNCFLVPVVLGVLPNRPPALLPAGHRVNLGGRLEVGWGFLSLTYLVSREELSVSDHAACAVQLDGRCSLAFKDPLGSLNALVPD